MLAGDFAASLERVVAETIIDDKVVKTIGSALKKRQFWEVAKTLGAYYNRPRTPKEIIEECRSIIEDIRDYQGEKALSSDLATTVVFGTSGWRGVIGEDFTALNVAKVVRGIIEMMHTPDFLNCNGYQSFAQVQKHGLVLLRDNRYLGDEFLEIAARELADAGVKMYLAGECPTGVGSALVTELNAAGSINFTPSHNPMDYAGVKFNPADGGPAGPELTVIIEEKANAYMGAAAAGFRAATMDPSALLERIDAKAIFTAFVEKKSKVFDLKRIRGWLREHKHELALVVDFMHGASRGYVQSLLGADVVAELADAGAIRFLHEDDDYSFHGVKPEPSAANQAPLVQMLKEMNRRFTLAVALDPDADRIRFADANLDVDMNSFGAIAYASLIARGIPGGICSTAPSSDFALEIARKEGREVIETAVGFKNFREGLGSGRAIIGFEESDGISCVGHTLEKCSLAGLLLALESMIQSGENLSAQYARLRAKYGYFYPSKAGADVTGVSVEAWEAYKKEVVDALQYKLYKAGDIVKFACGEKAVKDVNIIDGLKLVFADRSWILLRPSGTEPKFRYYFELASDTPLADEAAMLKDYENVAAAMLAKARELVDTK